MEKGLTFYKLVSPYPEDRTKNCGLLGEEIDNNFFNLKTEDIADAYWDETNKVLVLERVDGSKICVDGIVDGLSDFSFSYDPEEGVLIIKQADTEYKVEGFTTPDMINKMSSDDTIDGDGSLSNPLRVSPIIKTGVYRPAFKLIDTTDGVNTLPNENQVKKGDRYVTLENISDYGMLYNFLGVKSIANDLLCQGSEWRVPTKSDWDGMLNAVEPCDADRNHDSIASNRALGRIAGKLLKAKDFWKLECSGSTGSTCGTLPPGCIPTGSTDTEVGSDANPQPNRGVDSYGFKAMPAGYGDGGAVMDYFGFRGLYWTYTQISITDVYSKRFDYDRSTVYQETVSPNMLLSLRLVKDYTGDNFNERETINGVDYTCVLMPDYTTGIPKIWTVENAYFTNKQYCPVLPNSGYNLTYVEKYYVNEWDGFGWRKHILREGESIILKLGPNGEINEEWRVVNGVLQSIPQMIYDKVSSEVKEDIKKVDDKIENEINRATEAENALETNLANEAKRAREAEAKIAQDLQNEADRAHLAETTIATNLANEVERAKIAENTIADSLENEVERATTADEILSNNLDEEAKRAKEAEDTIANNLSNEVERAQAAETKIAEDLVNAKAELGQSINTVAEYLKNETEERFKNDICLSPESPYIIKANEGLLLKTNDGTVIEVEFDGDFGTF